MNIVFLHGPAASGKFTVGRELSRLTGYRLFHNHLVVDAVTAVFDFGSDSFVLLCEEMWLAVSARPPSETSPSSSRSRPSGP